MKSIKYLIRNYFGFTRRQANGALILLVLIFLSIIAPPIAKSIYSKPFPISIQDQKILDSLLLVIEKNIEIKKQEAKPQKIFTEIETSPKKNIRPKRPDRQQIKKFNLNKADSITLQSIRGIGKVLSSRIIKYRNFLGGFVKYEQLNEVYGLKEEVIARIHEYSFLEDHFLPVKLEINKLDSYQLSSHPYIERKTAYVIVNYRNQHGSFNSVSDLYKIEILDSTLIKKIDPYLSFD